MQYEPTTTPDHESVDAKIAAEFKAELAFDAAQQDYAQRHKLTLFLGRHRRTAIIALAGFFIVSSTLTALAVTGHMSAPSSQAGNTSATTEARDTNGNGAIDESEIAAADAASDQTRSTSGTDTADDSTSDNNDNSGDSADNSDTGDSTDDASDGDDTSDDSEPAPAAAVTSIFTIASWNTYSNDDVNMSTAAKKIIASANIIGFQEMHNASSRTQLRDSILCGSCTYTGYVVDYTSNGSTAASLPIVWNKSQYTLSSSGNLKVYDKVTGINDSTGKNVTVDAKYITWVKLRDNHTNKYFYVLNTNTVNKVDNGNGQPNGNTTRVNLYKKQMDMLTAKINEFKGQNLPVFLTADLNINYRTDSQAKSANFPYQRLGAVSMQSGYQILGMRGISGSAATEGSSGSLTDYVEMIPRSDVTPTSFTIYGDRMGSTHNPVLLKLNLTQ